MIFEVDAARTSSPLAGGAVATDAFKLGGALCSSEGGPCVARWRISPRARGLVAPRASREVLRFETARLIWQPVSPALGATHTPARSASVAVLASASSAGAVLSS